MPQGRTKLIGEGFVNVLVEPVPNSIPNVTVYGPYPTDDEAMNERRLLLSEMSGLSGKILSRRARMYTLPMMNWANSQRVEKAG